MNPLSHQGVMMALSGSSGDPYFSFVKSLLHFESTFSDTKGLTWSSASGSPVITTSSPLVGVGSGAFSTACISTPGNAAYSIAASQDFAIEVSVKFNTIPSSAAFCLASMYNNSSNGWSFQYRTDGGSRLQANLQGDSGTYFASWTPTAGVRYDLAVTRVAGVVRFFVNGVQVGGDNASTLGSTGVGSFMVIGGLYTGTFIQRIDAIMDEFRLTIGAGRYGGNYTPAFPFPDS